MKIGYIPMAAKPYHAGHDGLVRIAAAENDIVKLFVSITDRKRPGEVPIYGNDMLDIWQTFIQPTLPSNVEIEYSHMAPVRKIYEELEANEIDYPQANHKIYSDPIDSQKNWSDSKLRKYFPNAIDQGRLSSRPVERASTVDVSGTKMRKFLEMGNEIEFAKNLPKSLQHFAKDIFDRLTKNIR